MKHRTCLNWSHIKLILTSRHMGELCVYITFEQLDWDLEDPAKQVFYACNSMR